MSFILKLNGKTKVSFFAESDFRTFFANQSSKNTDAWKNKMKRWYLGEDKMNWKKITKVVGGHQDIINMFSLPESELLASRVKFNYLNRTKAQNISDIYNESFNLYNASLVNNYIYGMAKGFANNSLVIGWRQSKMDVSAKTLLQLNPNFVNEQESANLGDDLVFCNTGADPDAIMIVQVVVQEGGRAKVVRSYLRNPENPTQIMMFPGEVNTWKL